MTTLAELSPRWIGLSGFDIFYFGVSFDCPCCLKKRLAVNFWPPIDPEDWVSRITPIPHEGFHNRVSGDDFESLTISPSIGFDHIGHWHGHVTGGEIIT